MADAFFVSKYVDAIFILYLDKKNILSSCSGVKNDVTLQNAFIWTFVWFCVNYIIL